MGGGEAGEGGWHQGESGGGAAILQGRTGPAAPVEDARLAGAVAARLMRCLWPDASWDEADVDSRALCLRAAEVALVALRLRNLRDARNGPIGGLRPSDDPQGAGARGMRLRA